MADTFCFELPAFKMEGGGARRAGRALQRALLRDAHRARAQPARREAPEGGGHEGHGGVPTPAGAAPAHGGGHMLGAATSGSVEDTLGRCEDCIRFLHVQTYG